MGFAGECGKWCLKYLQSVSDKNELIFTEMLKAGRQCPLFIVKKI